MESMPTWVYTAIGTLVVSNVATIFTVIRSALKLSWMLSKMDSRIETNTEKVNRAHQRIDRLKEDLKQP